MERWYYIAKDAADPVAALARKVPSHAGTHPGMPAAMAVELEAQYRAHTSWTFQLHHDNLRALTRERPVLGPLPSYTTTARFMKDRGWLRHKKKKPRFGDRDRDETVAREPRETRSFEVSHVHALWHLDFHDGSRKLLTASGAWRTPRLLGVLDDHSRLLCHLQWYFDPTAENLIHALSQAIAKRGLPRALMTDNGAAMIAGETTEGLARLAILHRPTLANSPVERPSGLRGGDGRVPHGDREPEQVPHVALVDRCALGVERDGLVILRRPARRRGGDARGAYRVGRKGHGERQYEVWLESLAPPTGSCACADYGKSGLGLCKHLLAVLARLAPGQPRGRGAKATKAMASGRLGDAAALACTAIDDGTGPWLRWDPVRPFTGPGDWLDRVSWRPRAAVPRGAGAGP